MKIEFVEYTHKKYFFKIVPKMLYFRLIKNLGYLEPKYWKRFVRYKLRKHQKISSIIYLLKINGEIVGGISAQELPEDKIWYVGEFVLRKYENKGIAPIALKKFLEELKSNGVKKVRAEVFRNNKKSLHVLEKFNFKIVDKDKRDFILEKKLK